MAATKEKVPFSREVLRWAREHRQRTIEEAARKLGTSPSNVTDWEEGRKVPTVKQARELAAFYERPFLEFLRDEPPVLQEPILIPDFRLHRGAPDPRESRELLDTQAWAEEQRLNALDLYETLGDTPPLLPSTFKASLSDDVENIAERVRRELALPIEVQLNFRANERDALPGMLRYRFEQSGILVLRYNALKKLRARGMCIAMSPLPIIVFGGEAPSAQAFTLAHEFAHILLWQSAISGPPPARQRSGLMTHARAVELWCNRFAGAFLISANTLARFLNKPERPSDTISDEQLHAIARRFAVSPHAMLIRLVALRYVEASYYWERKRPQFLKEEEDYEPFGRPEYYGSRYRSEKGDLYTSLVMEAWNTGLITNHNAAEFMGIKNLRHLEEIRDRFKTG